MRKTMSDIKARLDYDDQPLDIMNEVNRVLYRHGAKLQFVCHDENQDSGIPAIFYDLEDREDWVIT
jgi:hypothetical protein